MKRIFFIFGLLIFVLPVFYAQEMSLDWDIDSLFDEPLSDIPEEPSQDSSDLTVESLILRQGLTFDASFEFRGGFAPGWDEAPWFSEEDKTFSWGQNVRMRADFSLDARISEVFRIKTVLYFQIPDFGFRLGDFFFDYNLFNTVFVRAGKYNHSWGISPNFSFTNLPARVPENGAGGESFLFRADIPVGVGGVQVLALTRANLLNNEIPGRRDIGFGGKYNLALRWADFDLGVYYQDNMAIRGFFSVKTTIGKTELYNEWLGAWVCEPFNFSGAFNLGFVQDFFNGRLSLNGELFYNAENDAFFYQPESSVKDADISPFIDGWNLALNLLYRFNGKLNPRFFVQALYAPQQQSAQLVPGIRLNPFTHTEFYLAVPMALGSRDGYYYSHTADPKNRPFSVILLLTLKGGVRSTLSPP